MRIIILGFGIVGKAIYKVLSDNLKCDVKVLSDNFDKFTDDKKWYFMAEKSLVDSTCFNSNIKQYLGDLADIHHSYIGQYSSILKYEDIYRKKVFGFPSGSSKSIAFKKYVMDGNGFPHEGKIVKTPVYLMGDWVKFNDFDDNFIRCGLSSINIPDKEVVFIQDGEDIESSVKYDLLISTIPLDDLSELIDNNSDNFYDADKNIIKFLENSPIYIVEHMYDYNNFFKGRRKIFSESSYDLKNNDYMRVFDFDLDSIYYQHIILFKEEIIKMLSLTINHDSDFIHHIMQNPGRIRKSDNYTVNNYIRNLCNYNIISLGRFGLWEGSRRVYDDLITSFKIIEFIKENRNFSMFGKELI